MLPLRLRLLLLPVLAIAAQAAPEALEVGPGNKDQLPRGKEADGIVGDFILRNDKVVAVISGNLPLRRANMSTFYGATGITPGCLYDLTLRDAGNDQITVFCPAGQQGPVSWVRVAKEGADGEAIVETMVTAPGKEGVSRRHEYRLRDGWQGVLVTTTLKNESVASVKAPTTDKWTNFKRTGTALGILWADAIDPADKGGYAYGPVEGAAPAATIELKPGEEVKFSRFLAVGTSPLEAFGEVAARRGAVGKVTGTVRDTKGAPALSAQIAVRPLGEFSRAIGIGYPDAQGRYSFAAPAGEYEVTFEDLGREAVTKKTTVTADAPQKLDAEMSVAAAVAFDIRDEAGVSLPCKAQFHILGGGEKVNLGPDNRAHGCADQYHSETGKFRVQLPPGRYRIVVTRGIEYSHLAQEVNLGAAQTASFAGVLKRLVDTTGWVSADYHNHSTPSGDNTCGTDDRLTNLAAEHVEFAPTTEHNRLYDWRPHIERLGLTPFLHTVPGMELTGSGAHFNSFPFKPEPFTQDNGAPVWNKDPRITGITLRDWQGSEPDRWVQINHPDMVENFIDRDADGQVDGGFRGLATLIDGVETQNYSASALLDGRPFQVSKDKLGKESVQYEREYIWLQMLNRGHRYAAMAVCDAHSVYGNGVGGWRMYLPSHTDEPSKIDWRENSRHAKAGHSILTTGPFLTVQTENGTGPGDTTRATAGVKLHVKVQCTDWLDIDRVQILVNGRARKELNFTRASHPDWFGAGVVKFDRTLDIPLSEDAHLIAVATGEKSDLSIGYGTSAQAKIKPFAYHNPIFVDLDGGGFTPNGDTLGWPLPVKKLSVEEARKMLAARGLDAE
jgi:hypothetical protein